MEVGGCCSGVRVVILRPRLAPGSGNIKEEEELKNISKVKSTRQLIKWQKWGTGRKMLTSFLAQITWGSCCCSLIVMENMVKSGILINVTSKKTWSHENFLSLNTFKDVKDMPKPRMLMIHFKSWNSVILMWTFNLKWLNPSAILMLYNLTKVCHWEIR